MKLRIPVFCTNTLMSVNIYRSKCFNSIRKYCTLLAKHTSNRGIEWTKFQCSLLLHLLDTVFYTFTSFWDPFSSHIGVFCSTLLLKTQIHLCLLLQNVFVLAVQACKSKRKVRWKWVIPDSPELKRQRCLTAYYREGTSLTLRAVFYSNS